jgi:hypothetical protein
LVVSLGSLPSHSVSCAVRLACVSGNGRFELSPFSLTFLKQPFAVVQRGRANSAE